MTKLIYTDSEGNEFNIVREPNAGGWLQGHVYVNYSELVSAFGNPHYLGSGDGKVQAEWTLKINGTMVTIYDYKQYGKPVQTIRDWHIGGTSKDAVEMVRGALAAYRRGQ